MERRGHFRWHTLSFIFISVLCCPDMVPRSHAATNALAVKVLVDEELTSSTAKAGEDVPIHVTEAVTKDGKEVIAVGAPVRARLTRVKRPGHGDRNGQIKLAMMSAQAVDGKWVPLHKGAVRRGSRLIALFAGPCSVPFPLTMLMVGEDVKIPKGQALTAYVRTGDLP